MRKLLRKKSVEELLCVLHERLLEESDCLTGINAVERRKKTLQAQLVMNKLLALQLRTSDSISPA